MNQRGQSRLTCIEVFTLSQKGKSRLTRIAVFSLGAPTVAAALATKGKWVEETAVVAVLIRKRTGVKNRRMTEKLAMGHEGNVTRAVRKADECRERKAELMKLEAMLVSRDRPLFPFSFFLCNAMCNAA